MCKKMHIAFLLFLTYFAKVDNTIFLSKILFYFVGMIFFCTFASLNQNNYYKKTNLYSF